jgi:hypothetical protein
MALEHVTVLVEKKLALLPALCFVVTNPSQIGGLHRFNRSCLRRHDDVEGPLVLTESALADFCE